MNKALFSNMQREQVTGRGAIQRERGVNSSAQPGLQASVSPLWTQRTPPTKEPEEEGAGNQMRTVVKTL